MKDYYICFIVEILACKILSVFRFHRLKVPKSKVKTKAFLAFFFSLKQLLLTPPLHVQKQIVSQSLQSLPCIFCVFLKRLFAIFIKGFVTILNSVYMKLVEFLGIYTKA